MDNAELIDYARSLVNVFDWWTVSGAGYDRAAHYQVLKDEWQRTKAELKARNLLDELQIG
jgi:hypothetical protein